MKENTLTNENEKQEIVPSIVAIILQDGSTSKMTFKDFEKMMFQSEEYECINKYLDDLNAPTVDEESEIYLSTVGRIHRIKK